MTLIEKLMSFRKIDERGCWLWTGSVNVYGYGQIRVGGQRNGGKNYRVHRLAAFLLMDLPLDSPLKVCHKCDIPNCFNPDHLFFGTQGDNLQDAVSKGRMDFGKRNREKQECKRGHPFTEENTRRANGRRICRVCARDSMRLRRAS
jgi:hypothetical protein